MSLLTAPTTINQLFDRLVFVIESSNQLVDPKIFTDFWTVALTIQGQSPDITPYWPKLCPHMTQLLHGLHIILDQRTNEMAPAGPYYVVNRILDNLPKITSVAELYNFIGFLVECYKDCEFSQENSQALLNKVFQLIPQVQNSPVRARYNTDANAQLKNLIGHLQSDPSAGQYQLAIVQHYGRIWNDITSQYIVSRVNNQAVCRSIDPAVFQMDALLDVLPDLIMHSFVQCMVQWYGRDLLVGKSSAESRVPFGKVETLGDAVETCRDYGKSAGPLLDSLALANLCAILPSLIRDQTPIECRKIVVHPFQQKCSKIMIATTVWSLPVLAGLCLGLFVGRDRYMRPHVIAVPIMITMMTVIFRR